MLPTWICILLSLTSSLQKCHSSLLFVSCFFWCFKESGWLLASLLEEKSGNSIKFTITSNCSYHRMLFLYWFAYCGIKAVFFCSVDFWTLHDHCCAGHTTLQSMSSAYWFLHMTVPYPFLASCTLKLLFLHQFCMYWLEIEIVNSCVCNLGTCCIIPVLFV